MSKKNIVYLLGAGASYNSLPVLNQMIPRMRYFLKYLRKRYPGKENEIADFENLCNEMEIFGTPDTLAKKHYLSRDTDFRVKKILSTFFIFEQLIKERETSDYYYHEIFKLVIRGNTSTYGNEFESFKKQLDSRYLSFFATIMEKDNFSNTLPVLPSNVSIVSWNYDMQIELAYQNFTQTNFNEAQRQLCCFPSIAHYNGPWTIDLKRENIVQTLIDSYCKDFALIKLNGVAGYKSEDSETLFDFFKHSTNKENMDMLINRLTEPRDSGNILNFAWDSKVTTTGVARQLAMKKIADANVVVIIGYSFPDFNRIIDKEIFSEEKLDAIYLQDPEANNIVQKLDGVKRGLIKKTKTETQTKNFIIPIEFWEYI